MLIFWQHISNGASERRYDESFTSERSCDTFESEVGFPLGLEPFSFCCNIRIDSVRSTKKSEDSFSCPLVMIISVDLTAARCANSLFEPPSLK